MESPRLQPKRVLGWGVALTIAGSVLTIFIPDIAWFFTSATTAATGVDQGILTLLDLVSRIVGGVVTPLGVVLIGAAVVMTYLRGLLQPRQPE
ncbi:hypothetical protein [Leifsonia aquatica]|uniref:Uncharacterized protein n=2 Tax=Leifsonia aquatica TaxID=144185 RepID=U2RCD7_LEIAQ|nr:hypothetical protein [Leifsonia aquatica]ERK66506.1 hypothetical protein N136_04735 [Leifsonia aquatica ATCC 14665]MBB2968811.1 uncharacterized protein with von Willebrand factor type A (vWA) domain [Leifsonia aquatica]